jgi:L-fuconolactonase
VVSTHDLEWATYAVRASGARIVSMPSGFDMAAPNVADTLSQWLELPGVLGIRVLLLSPSRLWQVPEDMQSRFVAGQYDHFFRVCERTQVPLMVGTHPRVHVIETLASRFPDLTIILDHLGIAQPPLAVEQPCFRHLADVLKLSKHRNVSVKLTGAPTLSAEPYPFRDIWPHLRDLLDAFGPDRLVWGSDAQRVNGRMANYSNQHFGDVGRHSYAEAVDYLRSVDWLTLTDRALIMGGTLRRLLRWTNAQSVTYRYSGSE